MGFNGKGWKTTRTGLEFDKVGDLSGGDVDDDRVVDGDVRVGVADGAAVVGDQERHLLRPHAHPLHLAQLELKHTHALLFC